MADLRQFDRVQARFQPKRTDDLRPGLEQWVGYEGTFEAMFEIEDGEYAGDWAMLPREPITEGRVPLDGYWVPYCDLTTIPTHKVQGDG